MVFTIIPAKPFDLSKSRLAPVLTPTQRVALSKTLLQRTIIAAQRIGPVVVISRDNAVRRLAKQAGAWALVETGAGLNAAVKQATEWVSAWSGASALILPADLPNLSSLELAKIARRGQNSPCVLLTPCHRDRGTNAMLLAPASLEIKFSFGEDSFIRHQQAACELGLTPIIYRLPTIAFDLDLPEDWEVYNALTCREPLQPRASGG